MKLTRSESRIEDPEDLRLAYQLYEYLRGFRRRSVEGQTPVLTFIDRFGPRIITVGFGTHRRIHRRALGVGVVCGIHHIHRS